jgi:hypothetical protein
MLESALLIPAPLAATNWPSVSEDIALFAACDWHTGFTREVLRE